MIITLNGRKQEFNQNLTVLQLLCELGIDSRKVAIERNLHLVKRDEHATAVLNEGDEVEIINFVGGG